MDLREPMDRGEYEIELREYYSIFRKVWWKVALLAMATGVIALIITFQMPNLYEATAVITPVSEEGKPASALGALTSLGIATGSPSKVEDLETLFGSNALTIRIFRKYDLWSEVFPERYDPAKGKLRMSWTDRLFDDEQIWKTPGDWDAIRFAKRKLTVAVNKRAGTISVTFESPSAESSAKIVEYYLEEGKSRLQDEALERAGKNKKFIEGQITRTADPLTRDRLYSLYGQEVEREMLARNREQFGFKIVDAAITPDRKSKPKRVLIVGLVTVLSAPIWAVFFLFLARRGETVSEGDR